MNRLELRSPSTEAEWLSYYDLRWRVLRAHWGQERGSERDERDAGAFNQMICNPDGNVIAAGRLHLNSPAEAQVRYMAVDPDYQGKDLGSAILTALETEARRLKAANVVLNSRDGAVPFYEKHGYRRVAEAPSLFGTIRHFRMEKQLDIKHLG